jgi:RecB family exonuclease
VNITGTDVRIRGKIDRLDRNTDGWVRVSDYKTGAEPKGADRVILGGGRELQRVIYALAARQLIPDNRGVIARLVYLAGQEPRAHKLPSIDEAITSIASHVTTAAENLRRGNVLTGEDAAEPWNDYRLALPSSFDAYLHRKKSALAKKFGDLGRVWRSK